jgi:hypothetical protein
MDAYVEIARESTRQAIYLAREGDVPAVLSLAFNPIVHLLLGLADRTPEELLDEILVPLDPSPSTIVLITHDHALVAEMIRCAPGPVFDLVGIEDCALTESPWYTPLVQPIGPAQIGMVERVLRLTDRAYVLDAEPRLDSDDALAVPGGMVTWIRHSEYRRHDSSLRHFAQALVR